MHEWPFKVNAYVLCTRVYCVLQREQALQNLFAGCLLFVLILQWNGFGFSWTNLRVYGPTLLPGSDYVPFAIQALVAERERFRDQAPRV